MTKTDIETFAVQCPCCGSELLIDGRTREVLHHTPARPASPARITDLAAEVSRLKTAETERERAFDRSLEAERTREARMDRKFDELLRRARQSPGEDAKGGGK